MTLDAKDEIAKYVDVFFNGEFVKDVTTAYNNPELNNQGFIEFLVFDREGKPIITSEGNQARLSMSGRVDILLKKNEEECCAVDQPVDNVQVPKSKYTGPTVHLTANWSVSAHDVTNPKCACPNCLIGFGGFPRNPRQG